MAPPKRILVVDDSEDLCELYQLILGARGYEVETVGDGARGFERTRAWRPDLVILDVVMPVMDGLQLLLTLRSDLVPPIPPVILCSGFDLTEEEALRRGAVCFLRKPIEHADLIEAVEDALSGRAIATQSVQRQRAHASIARDRVLAGARDLVHRLDAHGTESLTLLQDLAQSKIETVASYVGIPRGALALVRDDGLRVLAATADAALPRDFDLGSVLPEAYEVVETGSSLLLPDATAHPFSSVSRSLGGIRFFAGVPLRVAGRAVVGVVCLFDASTHQIDSDDILPLAIFGRRGSDVLIRFADKGQADRIIRYGRGLVASDIFEELLDVELRILEGRGGSMELAVLDVTDVGIVQRAMAGVARPQRLLGGMLSRTRVALFKRARDDSARSQIAAIVDELRTRDGVGAVGFVDVRSGGVCGLGARDLVHVASIALDRAVEASEPAHRILIQEEHGI